MRRLLCALLLVVAAGAWGEVTYFGYTSPGDGSINPNGYTRWLIAGFSCPDSGVQNVASLDVWITNAGAGTVRAGIYTSGGTMIAEWAAALDPSGTGWLSGTSFVDSDGDPISPQLTGGTTYLLVTYVNGATIEIGYKNTADNAGAYLFDDYSGGLPTTLGVPTTGAWTLVSRCGVEATPVVTYNVTYDGNGSTGGTVPTDAGEYAEGASVTVAANSGSLVRTGYAFSAWNTAANLSGTSYAVAGTYTMPANDATLYATWTHVVGTTNTAATCQYPDVVAAITTSDAGDTLVVPAGSATWTESATVSKAITISGTGVTLTASGTLTNGFFRLYNLTSTDLVRITRFTFDLNDADGGSAIGFATLSLTKLRIDHNTVHHGSTAMEVVGCKGVIDNNYFYNPYRAILFSAGTRAQADASWESMAAGTGDALFIEDNHFIFDADWDSGTGNDNTIDTYNGGKLVVRYNTFDSTNIPAGFTSICWTIQIHGSAAAGTDTGYWQNEAAARRGQSVVEIYGNTMTGKNLGRLATIRGSASLVWGNSINSLTYSTTLEMYEEECYEAQWVPLRTSWPAEDQVHNTFIWGNTFNGEAQAAGNISVGEESVDFIQQDRDYFLHRPATVGEGMTLGIETFTGDNGASGTNPTDGDPYPNHGTMEFTADVENAYYGYTPYTYPHPLRGEGGDGQTSRNTTTSIALGILSGAGGPFGLFTLIDDIGEDIGRYLVDATGEVLATLVLIIVFGLLGKRYYKRSKRDDE